jgi:DtxR family transcriptional regulator, Mn-dependent transcriptional regulator
VRNGLKLSLVKEGQARRILRVSDQNPEKLCYLGKLGLYPETQIEVLERAPFGGPLRVRIGEAPEQAEYMLGVELAEHIIVSEPLLDNVSP